MLLKGSLQALQWLLNSSLMIPCMSLLRFVRFVASFVVSLSGLVGRCLVLLLCVLRSRCQVSEYTPIYLII